MEKAVKDGKVRAIGLSNFYPDRFVDMAEYAEIKPAVNQLKTNVFSQQWEAEAEMNLYDTHIMAWAPLAQGNPELLTNPVLTALAERYNKNSAAGGSALLDTTRHHRHSEEYSHRTYETKSGCIRLCPHTGRYGKHPSARQNPTTSVGRTVIPNSQNPPELRQTVLTRTIRSKKYENFHKSKNPFFLFPKSFSFSWGDGIMQVRIQSPSRQV